MKSGDSIAALGPHKNWQPQGFDNALRKFEAGESVPIVVMRGKDRVELEVVLDPIR